MATTPLFVGSGFPLPLGSVTAISTDRTGAGSYSTVVTGAPSMIRAIRFQATTLTIDTMLMLFYYDGANTRLLDEIRIVATTPTNVNAGWSHLWVPPVAPLIMPASDVIKAAMYSGSATIHAWAIGGDL